MSNNENYRNQNDRNDQNQSTERPQAGKGNSKGPSHIAFQVRDVEGGKAYFNRIGSAFAHKDGEGFNLLLDSTPVDGRVTLRTPKERVDDMKQGKGADNGRSSSQQRNDGPQYDR